ncbi:unnamed protein product [Pedinophyceae sp. YPF-701]|nr:unnamed protein product [Pedinophyceae sp. YPF-701]
MVRLTLITRLVDGLPLAEGLDTEQSQEIDAYKHSAKDILKRISAGGQPTRLSIDAGKYVYHYIIEQGVCYLTLAEKAYPRKLAYEYLDELVKEFQRLYLDQIDKATRPYAFIKFDTFIQKTRKLYLDTRTQRNLAKLNNELREVHQIMTTNIRDVLGQGEKLERMQQMSSALSQESKKYSKKTRDMYWQAVVRQYTPLAAIILIALLVIWIRWKL